MKKKTIIASVIISVFLIGIVSAGLVGYLSNMVSGEVNVEGPVFYAISGAKPDGTPGTLSINSFLGGTSFTVEGGDTRYFKTEKVGSINFYAPEVELSVNASLEGGINPSLLDLTFGYYDTFTKGIEYPFCNIVINVTSEDSVVYSGICDGNSTDKLEAFYYSIHNKGTNDVRINVKTYHGDTKVKVLGVAQ